MCMRNAEVAGTRSVVVLVAHSTSTQVEKFMTVG